MNRKLTHETAQTILDRAAAGELQKDLATEYGLSEAAVSKLISGKSWPGLRRTPTKPRHASKLSPKDIPIILQRLAVGEKLSTVAESYGITRQAIANIQKGRAWADVPRPEAPRPARKRVWEQ